MNAPERRWVAAWPWARAARSVLVAPLLAAVLTTAVSAQDEICAKGPHFMIMHERPELENGAAVDSAILAVVEKYRVGVTDSIMLLPWLYLDDRGAVKCSQLEKGTGTAALDSVAVEVGRMMRFVAARRDGVPVPMWVQVPVVLKPRAVQRR